MSRTRVTTNVSPASAPAKGDGSAEDDTKKADAEQAKAPAEKKGATK